MRQSSVSLSILGILFLRGAFNARLCVAAYEGPSMHVRVALWLVAALWAAITSDVLLEAAENAGYFGALRDADHESLMPAVLLALLALVALVGLVVRERRRGHDALLAVGQRMRRGFAADAFATFALTGLAVVAMESYEQTFGGASLFAAHGLLALNAGVTFGTYFLAATLFVATLVWPLRALAVASDRALQQLAHWLSAYTTLTRDPDGRIRAVESPMVAPRQ